MACAARLIRRSLIAALAFLSITAICGGIGLISGLAAPPVEMLNGSPFKTYLVPGLSLLLVVGGSAALALVLVLRSHPFAMLVALAAAAAITVFELVEIAVIGSPPGPSRAMQVFYICLGVAIAALALLRNGRSQRAG